MSPWGWQEAKDLGSAFPASVLGTKEAKLQAAEQTDKGFMLFWGKIPFDC